MSKQQTQERESRKPKPENRFYNFLSRSRSRSRTKDARIDGPASSRDTPSNTVLPNSKPPARITSRPISTTTTTTNATVVPSTPKATRARPVPITQSSEVIGPDQQIPPGSSIPKLPGTRRKLHNLFGIHLVGQKKPSFGAAISQPGSSRSSLDVPPMPTQVASLRPNSRHKGAPSRSHSPGFAAKVGHKATTSLTDISNVQCPAPSANMFHRLFSGSKGAQADTVPPVSVSGPIRRPSQHRTTKSDGKLHLTDKPLPELGSTTSVPGPFMPPPPHIIYTPATPERPTSSSSPCHGVKKVSLRLSKRSRSTDAKGKEREVHQHPTKGDPTTRSGKRGVFDFENPPWNVGTFSVQRSDSGGTDDFSRMSAWNRHTDRAIPERDSTIGPGLAGLGTIQREMSLRRGKEWEEQLRVREVERKKLIQEQRKQRHEQSSSQNTPPAETDHAGGSTSTVGTGHSTGGTGHSSSWGKAAGKRAAMSVKTGSGSGLPKMTNLTHHPAFDFEPPVPSSSSWSTSSLGMPNNIPPSSGEKRSTGKWQQKPRLSEERRPSPAPSPASIGHRSALKGRSLDLGLGLAWAPSTVREEALLPLLNIGRSFSHSSSASESHNTGKSTASSNGAKAGNEGMSQLGKEVAAVFKSTLDRDGFANFKRYVHQFDAHEIPFDGPTGIISRIEQLLGESSTLQQHEKRELMDQLVRIILRNA